MIQSEPLSRIRILTKVVRIRNTEYKSSSAICRAVFAFNTCRLLQSIYVDFCCYLANLLKVIHIIAFNLAWKNPQIQSCSCVFYIEKIYGSTLSTVRTHLYMQTGPEGGVWRVWRYIDLKQARKLPNTGFPFPGGGGARGYKRGKYFIFYMQELFINLTASLNWLISLNL